MTQTVEYHKNTEIANDKTVGKIYLQCQHIKQ